MLGMNWTKCVAHRAENMMSTLKMMREKYGSAEGYMIEKCGLTQEELIHIRKNLVVKEPAVHVRHAL